LDVLRAVVFGRGSLRLRGQWRSRRVRAVFSSPKHLLRAGRGNGQRADGGGVDSVDADGFLSVHGGAGLQRPPGNSASHDIADSSTPVETGPETRQATACRSRRGCVVSLFRAVPVRFERAQERWQFLLLGPVRAAGLGIMAAPAAEIRTRRVDRRARAGHSVRVFRRARHGPAPAVRGHLQLSTGRPYLPPEPNGSFEKPDANRPDRSDRNFAPNRYLA